MRQRKLIFNWKMNPESKKRADKLFIFAKKHSRFPIVIAPPFIYLEELTLFSKKPSKIKIASQDVSYAPKGAYTGEVSVPMLKKLGVWGSIIGHSERRYIFKENNKLISKKIQATQKGGLAPILCVGEKKKSSLKESWDYVKKQIDADIKLKPSKKMIIAYEPVWSIGGDKETDSKHSAKIIGLIKESINKKFKIRIPVLYGGSVNCRNISSFLKYPEIDGFLVGSASLKEKEISCIIKKINQ